MLLFNHVDSIFVSAFCKNEIVMALNYNDRGNSIKCFLIHLLLAIREEFLLDTGTFHFSDRAGRLGEQPENPDRERRFFSQFIY